MILVVTVCEVAANASPNGCSIVVALEVNAHHHRHYCLTVIFMVTILTALDQAVATGTPYNETLTINNYWKASCILEFRRLLHLPIQKQQLKYECFT